jgi:hypothetical protein
MINLVADFYCTKTFWLEAVAKFWKNLVFLHSIFVHLDEEQSVW